MSKKCQQVIAPDLEKESITYKIDKMTFIVTPVHRENSGKTIHDLILNLMKKIAKNLDLMRV